MALVVATEVVAHEILKADVYLTREVERYKRPHLLFPSCLGDNFEIKKLKKKYIFIFHWLAYCMPK